MDETYRWAAERLEAVGAGHVARRMSNASASPDRTPISAAVTCAIDSVDAARAARLDPLNGMRWLAISQDQRRRSGELLSACLTVRV